jgi:hypothetical protein
MTHVSQWPLSWREHQKSRVAPESWGVRTLCGGRPGKHQPASPATGLAGGLNSWAGRARPLAAEEAHRWRRCSFPAAVAPDYGADAASSGPPRKAWSWPSCRLASPVSAGGEGVLGHPERIAARSGERSPDFASSQTATHATTASSRVALRICSQSTAQLGGSIGNTTSSASNDSVHDRLSHLIGGRFLVEIFEMCGPVPFNAHGMPMPISVRMKFADIDLPDCAIRCGRSKPAISRRLMIGRTGKRSAP